MSENLPNKAVFQSYIWTCAKYDFSPYEKRIIYRLIEFAQHWLEGVKIKDHMHKIEPTDCGVNITMPVADILRDETDNNYAKAKAAFTSLSKKGAEYEDDEIWFYPAIIEHPKIKKGTGVATFHVYEPVWRAALDFTKGFKKYELVTAMKFKSDVIIESGEKRIVAKSVLNVMAAGIKCGTEITLICDGEDEAEAMKTISEAIESGLGEM